MLRLFEADNPRFVASVVMVVPVKGIALVRKLILVVLDNVIVSLPYKFNVPEVPAPLNVIVVACASKVVADSPMKGEIVLNSVDASVKIACDERVTLVSPERVRVDALTSPSVVASK